MSERASGVGLRCAIAGVYAVAFVTLPIMRGHDTWLLPEHLRVPVGKPVTIQLTRGVAFPGDDLTVPPARVTRSSVRAGERLTTLGSGLPQPLALQYSWTPRQAGLITFAVALAPADMELQPLLVREYLSDIGALPEIRMRWARMPASRRWRERDMVYAKSYVCAEARGDGTPVPDSGWTRPALLGFEIMPLHDPTALRAGDALSVRVLYRGAPAADVMVGARREGEPITRFVPTNASGRTEIELPDPGVWLLTGTRLRRAADSTREWDGDFTTLTVSVQPRKLTPPLSCLRPGTAQ